MYYNSSIKTTNYIFIYSSNYQVSGHFIISALGDTSIYNDYPSNYNDDTLQSNGYQLQKQWSPRTHTPLRYHEMRW